MNLRTKLKQLGHDVGKAPAPDNSAEREREGKELVELFKALVGEPPPDGTVLLGGDKGMVMLPPLESDEQSRAGLREFMRLINEGANVNGSHL